MTGRGRGRPPRNSPNATPVPTSMGPPMGPSQPAFGAGGIPNFTTDILNQLPPPKQTEMMALVNRFRSKQMALPDFLAHSKVLLGDRLYSILAQGMSSLVRVPGPAPGVPTAAGGSPFMMVRPPMTTPQGASTNEDVEDVSKMDSASLQDVIQYSGVDLRAEASLMESELHHQPNPTMVAGQDLRMRPDHFFNLPRMKAIVYMAVKSKGITAVSEEVFELLALALQRRLSNLITSLSETSKHRVDAGRVAFKIKVENDPKKQLWLLERVLEEQLERTKLDYMAATSSATSKPSGSGTDDKGIGSSSAKTKKAAAAEKKAAGDDVIVKTRLANTTAMAALGLTQKSWMTAGIVGLQQQQQQQQQSSTAKTTNPESDSQTTGTEEAVEAVKIPLHFSQAPSATPVTDRDLLHQHSFLNVCKMKSSMGRHPMESCFTCKAVSTAGILGVATYLALLSRKAPNHARFLQFSSLSNPHLHAIYNSCIPWVGFVGFAGFNWWIRTGMEDGPKPPKSS